MNPTIHARANFPPFARLGRLATADDIDSAGILMGSAQAVFRIAQNDANVDLVHRGAVVEIASRRMLAYSIPDNEGIVYDVVASYAGGNEYQWAESFKTPESGAGTLDDVQLPLSKTGAPTGDLGVILYADDGSGKPGAVVATADTTLDVSTLTGTDTWHTFSFDPVVSLDPDTTYHVAWDTTGLTHDNAKYVRWSISSAPLRYPGHCSGSIDGAVSWSIVETSDLRIRLGVDWVGYYSDRVGEPWIGYIERLLFDHADGTVEVECIDVQGMLSKRHTGTQSSRTGAAGLIARDLLFQANARNPFGLWWDSASEAGSPVAEIDLGGMSLLDAFNRLADDTGNEWYVYCVVRPDRLEMYLRWCAARGIDLSQQVYLREGYEISAVTYSQDALEEAESVMVVGGGGVVEDRPTVIRASSSLARITEAGVYVEGASESYRRAVPLPPALADERVKVSPRQTDVGVLADAARQELEAPLYSAEGLQLAVNTRADWNLLAVGNIVRASLENTPWGALNRRIRITEAQRCSDGLLRLEVQVLRD